MQAGSNSNMLGRPPARPTSPTPERPAGRPARSQPQTPRSTPGQAQQRALQLLQDTPPPFSLSSRLSLTQRPQSQSQNPGGSMRRSVLIGQSKADAVSSARTAALMQKLFGGQPPLVKSRRVGQQQQYRWPDQPLPESMAADILAVCRFWLARADTHADALALLDAVYQQTQNAELWHALLGECGDALVQAAPRMAPQQLLDWLRRLHRFAQSAQQQHAAASAAQALLWGQALVQSQGLATQGTAAKAARLLQRWQAEAASWQLPPATPQPDRHGNTSDDISDNVSEDTHDDSPLRPRLGPMPERRPASALIPRPPEFRLDAQEPAPRTPVDSPRPRPAWPRLPPLKLDHEQLTAPGPLCQSLWRAHARNDFQAFCTALLARRYWRQHHKVPQDLIDDLNHSLRELLPLLDDPTLTPAQRADLLRRAYPLVVSHAEDPMLAHRYTSAIRSHLPPAEAERLLLALDEPLERLPPEHPYRRRLAGVKRLMDWGLPEAVAQRLGFEASHLWAEALLLQPPPSFGGPSRPARLRIGGEGAAVAFTLIPGPPLSDAEIDAVLTLAEAWADDAPELAMKLLRATREAARLDSPHEDPGLLLRWSRQVRKLQQYRAFSPWLSVQRNFDPLLGRFSELKCQIDADGAARAGAVERQRTAQRLWSWVDKQMHSPRGLAWEPLVALLHHMDKAFGDSPLFHFEQWLHMSLWELERSGDAEPLRLMLPHLSEQALKPETLLSLLRVLQRPWPDELVCVAALQLLVKTLAQRDAHTDTAEHHAALLQAVLARRDDEMRHTLVQQYLAQHPFSNQESSGDLLQQLAQLRCAQPPSPSAVWDFLMDLTPPGTPASWRLWCRLCQQLAPWISSQLQPPVTATATTALALPHTPPTQQTLEAVWNLSRSAQGDVVQALEQQFQLLAALADALPPAQRLALLSALDAACADWAQAMNQTSQGGPGTAAPLALPTWLIALRGSLQALSLAHGGEAPTHAQADPALGFFRDWFGARLAERRGEQRLARQCALRLRQQHAAAEVGGPIGRVISSLLQGPLPGEDPA